MKLVVPAFSLVQSKSFALTVVYFQTVYVYVCYPYICLTALCTVTYLN